MKQWQEFALTMFFLTMYTWGVYEAAIIINDMCH